MDKEIEIQKESLFSHEKFNTIDAFKVFDQDNKGYVTQKDIEDISINENLFIEDAIKIIKKFDKDQDGKLNYLEFTKAITPKKISYIN